LQKPLETCPRFWSAGVSVSQTNHEKTMRPVIRTVLCSIVLMLYAGTTMASAPPPPPAKKKDENACKPARPGTYVPGGATFPVLCPKGTTSEAKSRSVGECVPVK
jgi:hypothetical protein